MTRPTGKSTGSLQVKAWSPSLAAILPLILTLALPNTIVPLLAGGFTNEPGGGTICGGILIAILPTVAAAIPMILTLGLRLPVIVPLNGKGVGTGAVSGGTMTRCVSIATIVSPCFAAGFLITINY